jgi:hypothetical protein
MLAEILQRVEFLRVNGLEKTMSNLLENEDPKLSRAILRQIKNQSETVPWKEQLKLLFQAEISVTSRADFFQLIRSLGKFHVKQFLTFRCTQC